MTDLQHMIISGLYIPPGSEKGSWRHEETPAGAVTSIEFATEMAKLCEQGKLDLFFVADTPAVRLDDVQVWSKSPHYHNALEPLTLLSAIAMGTSRIGLGATVSTTFFEPFNIARQFASLDFISKGRAAWNVVTTANDYAALNFGMDRLPPRESRYQKARESVLLVKEFWDTWEDDAFVYDKPSATYFDPEKLHPVDFDGEFFTAKGGLNIARPPQGHPVILEAGASNQGMEFAAETAEVVFGPSATVEQAKTFYDDLKGRLAKFGRGRDELKIISGYSAVVGETTAEAEAKREYLESLVPIESRIMALCIDLETDLFDLPLDEPVPVERIPESSNHHQAYFEQIAEMIRSGRYTLRELAKAYNRASATFCGTPVQVADFMEEWVDAGASDGFMVTFTHMPGSIRDFVTLVVPELQRRGRFRSEYEGTTLREHLGLARPANVHVTR